jgi:coenzyme F420 hydrogenase subunit beta
MIRQHKEMSSLCFGCGICLGICPVNAINLKNSKGVTTVNFDYSRCTHCMKCNVVCPALFQLGEKSSNFLNTLGRIEKTYFGYSTDPDIRYHAASGGVITALSLYMLKHKIVDKVLVTRMKGIATDSLLTNNKVDIISAQGSIYFKPFSLRILPELIRQLRERKRICVIGLPCQISALKNVLREFEDNLYFISLICNHTNELWYLEHLLAIYLPKNAKPLMIGSRKNGWPGGIKAVFTVGNKNPQELIIPYDTGVWGLLPSLNISAPLGCLTCTDHLATAADVVAGDAWHPKFIEKKSPGVSIIVVRTNKGLQIVDSAIKDGNICSETAKLKDLIMAQWQLIIEGSQYGVFRKKLIQHKIWTIGELKELDKTIIALLTVINYFASKTKVVRKLLGTSLAKKSLTIALWQLSERKSMRLLKTIAVLKNGTK